jgi:hypothetical protein
MRSTPVLSGQNESGVADIGGEEFNDALRGRRVRGKEGGEGEPGSLRLTECRCR